MYSIRTKINLLTVAAAAIGILVTALISIYAIKVEEDRHSQEHMLIIAESCEQTLDTYLNSIKQSVDTIARFSQAELHQSTTDLADHLDLIDRICHSVADHTDGAESYFYRISPDVSDSVTGFCYAWDEGRNSLVRQTPTSLDKDKNRDHDDLEWYTIPKESGAADWIGPYYSERLEKNILSYVFPIQVFQEFKGVVGIDVSLDVMIEEIKNVRVFESGYAFLTDENGIVVYHPTLNPGSNLDFYTVGTTEESVKTGVAFMHYRFRGVEKSAACTELSNGMKLYVSAPQKEINAVWIKLITQILASAFLLLIGTVIVSTIVAQRMTKPLVSLVDAAERIDAGDYDVELAVTTDDEVGTLTRAFRQLTGHLKVYISDLNNKAYSDALTAVRNKGAMDIHLRKLNDSIKSGDTPPVFALCMFDLNDLKGVNDVYGHEKGDRYLKNACELICRVFRSSPVFRVGGDEFTAILQRGDFVERKELFEQFDVRSAEINAAASEPWERVSVAKGCAVYDPSIDENAEAVLARADAEMYKNKHQMKEVMDSTGGAMST